MGNNLEKREYPRIFYENIDKPKFVVKKNTFEVVDISQQGIRFINDKRVLLTKHLSGTLSLNNGDSVEIKGLLKWEKDFYFGLSLEELIPSSIIDKEQLFISGRET